MASGRLPSLADSDSGDAPPLRPGLRSGCHWCGCHWCGSDGRLHPRGVSWLHLLRDSHRKLVHDGGRRGWSLRPDSEGDAPGARAASRRGVLHLDTDHSGTLKLVAFRHGYRGRGRRGPSSLLSSRASVLARPPDPRLLCGGCSQSLRDGWDRLSLGHGDRGPRRLSLLLCLPKPQGAVLGNGLGEFQGGGDGLGRS